MARVIAGADSKATLARTLRGVEYFTLSFGTMVGVGWLIVIDDWLTRGGPGGAALGFFLGGVALIPIGFVYGKFVREIPDAASEVAYATVVFPRSIGFLAGWLMTLAYLIVCPWEAVAIGKILAYIFPVIQTNEIYRVARHPVYLPALTIGLAAIALITFLNYRGIRLSARFQNLTTFGLLALFGVFTIVGFSRDRLDNLSPFFNQPVENNLLSAVISVVMVLQIVPYFLTGFESVPKCSEEAQEKLHPRGFTRAIFLGLATGTAFYVVIIVVVAGLVPWQSLRSESFATAVAFERAFQSSLMARFIVLAALLSLLKVFNANFLAASRLVFALGRRGMIPSAMGQIHRRFQAPSLAVLFCGAVTVGGALLGESILIPVTEVGSMCSALGWMITCVAFAKRNTGEGARRREAGIAWLGAAVAMLLLLIKLVPFVPGSFRLPEYLALAGWLAVGLALWRKCPASDRTELRESSL